MADFFLYFFSGIGALIGGFILTWFGYLFFGKIGDWRVRRSLPKMKKSFIDTILFRKLSTEDQKLEKVQISKALRDNKERFMFGEKLNVSEKEVEEDERNRLSEFREFEKLRKLASAKPIARDSEEGFYNPIISDNRADAGRGNLSSNLNSNSPGTKPKARII